MGVGGVALVGWTVALLAGVLAVRGWRVGSLRAELVARACHELRGPLAAVRLGVELGVRRGKLAPAQLRAIDQELGRASLALDDLALTSRGHTTRAPLELVDLSSVLSASVEAWRPAAGGRELRLVMGCRTPPVVRGDRRRLAQAVGNLIANAVEHGGGVVEVGVVVGGSCAGVYVSDEGEGLSALPAPSARRRGAGRGYGLAIVSAIAAAHGGRLEVVPLGCGARLVLELPLASG